MRIWSVLSYLFPIPVKRFHSPLNGLLEINWENGKKVLNSKRANYSYGSLHSVFQKALSEIDCSDEAFSSCLVLGFGAGSIYSILRRERRYKGRIVGVEYDETYREILPEFIPQMENVKMVYVDAETYLKESTSTFPLVLADLFVDKDTLKLSMTPSFVEAISRSVEAGGMYIHNTMMGDKGRERDYFLLLEQYFSEVSVKEYLGSNSVYYCKK